jgi:hypothetical protein
MKTVSTTTESTASAIAGGMALFATIFLILFAAAVILSTPANAGQYDGTPWSVGFSGNSEWDPAKCELCRAENRRSIMTGCVSSTAEMEADRPYIIYCGDGIWGYNGSAPGTYPVDPGESVGRYRADKNDWWTVKE